MLFGRCLRVYASKLRQSRLTDGHVSVDYEHVWIAFTDMNFYVVVVQIIKVLGEGGFSFVYLAQDEHSGVCSDTVLDEVGMLKSSALMV